MPVYTAEKESVVDDVTQGGSCKILITQEETHERRKKEGFG